MGIATEEEPAMVRTAVPFQLDRTLDPKAAMQFAQMLETSGVVDDFMAWDQVQGWWPRSLYSIENTPLAAMIEDPDSFHDAFLLAAYASAATSGLGLVVTTDAIRRGPGELLMSMFTLAGATQGQAVLMLGAGEAKQVRPLGYRRSEGLTRMEDFFKARELFAHADAPFDFDGNHWKMRNAWLGSTRPHLPKVWSMGGGPQLIDLATRYADGFTTVVPMVFPRVDEWAEQVRCMKRDIERHGRDPETFDFGVWVVGLLHDDEERLERALDNPLLRFLAAVFGRLNQADWDREGLEPVFPRDWHYALKYIPTEYTREQADDVVARTSREMTAKSYIYGDPKSVAAQIAPFVEAGATHVALLDLMQLLLPPDEAFQATERSIEFCRILKGVTA
jgi:phthiodiolone/phenolphthiodiolone dimycocerosates ketoreductase